MKNQAGQSLVQVLMAVAIMGIVLMAMTSMFTSLNRETQAISEKLAAMDVEKLMITSLADGSGCAYALTNPASLTFNSTTPMTDAQPQVVNLPPNLYTSYIPGTPPKLGPPVAQVGKQASPTSTSLFVSSIKMELTEMSAGIVKGRLRIDFDNSKLVRPIKPAYASVTLTPDPTTLASSPAAVKFNSCQVTSMGGGGGNGTLCGAFIHGPYNALNGPGTITISKVVTKCQGKQPSCPAGMTPTPGDPYGPCKQGYYYFGYSTASVCPSGYSLTHLLTAAENYIPGGVNGGSNYDSQTPTNMLFSCIPN